MVRDEISNSFFPSFSLFLLSFLPFILSFFPPSFLPSFPLSPSVSPLFPLFLSLFSSVPLFLFLLHCFLSKTNAVFCSYPPPMPLVCLFVFCLFVCVRVCVLSFSASSPLFFPILPFRHFSFPLPFPRRSPQRHRKRSEAATIFDSFPVKTNDQA